MPTAVTSRLEKKRADSSDATNDEHLLCDRQSLSRSTSRGSNSSGQTGSSRLDRFRRLNSSLFLLVVRCSRNVEIVTGSRGLRNTVEIFRSRRKKSASIPTKARGYDTRSTPSAYSSHSSACIPSGGTSSSPLLAMVTGLRGLSPLPLGKFSMASTTL